MNRIIFNEHMNFHLITSHRFSRIWTCSSSSFFENKFHSINLIHCENERESGRGSLSNPSQTHLLLFRVVFLCVTNGNVCGECEKMNQSPIDPFPETYFIKFIWFSLSCCASFFPRISFNFGYQQRELLRVNMQISYNFFFNNF